MKLTEDQQLRVIKARELAALKGAGELREHVNADDLAMAYALGFGEAQWVLADLLAIIDELTGAAQ